MLLEYAKVLDQDNILVIINESFMIFNSREKSARILPWEDKDTKFGPIKLLKTSSTGTHLAFFHSYSESFILLNTSGDVLYSRRINTDKAEPLDIRFSPDGEVVAFFSEREGIYQIFLFNFKKGYSTQFESDEIPFGCDSELRYFIKNKLINPQKKGYENISIYDRHGTKRGKFCWVIDWIHLGFNASKCVLLTDDDNVECYSDIFKKPILSYTLNIKEILARRFYRPENLGKIALAGDNVLFVCSVENLNHYKL